jgi:two-component system sensor histidine kinase DctS
VEAAPSHAGVDVTVHDSGPGLPDDQCEAVFAPFHSTKPEGMGLGLTICRKIVAAHNGHMHASNHPRGGAVFHMFLPADHA